jgi:peptidoglycan/LPS O-acetylase OafA/YrhL
MFSRLAARLSRITTSGDYVPEVDGVRFVAIAMVLVQHLHERVFRLAKANYSAVTGSTLDSLLTSGGLGVMLFFALSGYILFQILTRPLDAGRPLSLRAYFWRRLTRLEPPYVVITTGIFLGLVMGVVKGGGKYLGGGEHPLWQSWLATITYTHSLLFGGPSSINPPGWSLEIEVQFYLLAPLVAYGFCQLRHGWGRVLVVGMCIVFWCWQFQFNPQREPRAYYSLLQWLPYFLTGFVVLELVKMTPARLESGLRNALADLGALAGLGLLLFIKRSPLIPLDLLRCVLIGAVMYGAFRGNWVRRALQVRWVAIIGGMCYTLYLIHLPLEEMLARATFRLGLGLPYAAYLLLQSALVLPIVTAVGAIFFVLVERPCMDPHWPAKLADRWRKLGRRA